MKALVTGGGGFLGLAIVKQLIARGDVVRSFSRAAHPALAEIGVEHRQGDLADPEHVRGACAGCDVVFHVAAKAGIWGPYEQYHRTNVTGTENVLAACRTEQVPRLVYTGSPSVVFHGGDLEGVDETTPYATRFEAAYPKTKMLAEKEVLNANGPDLATVALRPHLIWGPGDNHLLPRLFAKARAGQLRRLGTRPNRVDSIYIDNAAEAHLRAADRLQPGAPIAGKSYFISQGDPWPLWDLINALLATAEFPPVERSVPAGVAYAAGWMLEIAYGALQRKDEPPMTRFLANQLSHAHWFDISAARRDLGYTPRVSTAQGLNRLADWLSAAGSGDPVPSAASSGDVF